MNYSKLLCNLAKIFLDKYDSYKTENSLLDYDDLIYLTQLLLTDDSTKSWVSYKLDGGIEHLLVDEAQDASPEQWTIITAIIAEFCSTTIVNSGEFGARSDGATPICNRRVTSDDVPNFSSIDYKHKKALFNIPGLGHISSIALLA